MSSGEALFDVAGRVALVTGASSGLGRHFALTLAARGAIVVAAARRVDRLEAVVAEIAAAGGRAQAVALDVTDAQSVAAAFAQAESSSGVPSIVVNNAGIAEAGPALGQPEADWRAVLETNLEGAYRVAQAAAQAMVAAGRGGSIVNIASILALRVGANLAAYAAAKAGLLHATRALALEWARHGIRVNAIAPGYILTDMNREFFATEAGQAMVKRIPQRRIGNPADLDGALLLLASDAGAYMTGTVVVADGGHVNSSL